MPIRARHPMDGPTSSSVLGRGIAAAGLLDSKILPRMHNHAAKSLGELNEASDRRLRELAALLLARQRRRTLYSGARIAAVDVRELQRRAIQHVDPVPTSNPPQRIFVDDLITLHEIGPHMQIHGRFILASVAHPAGGVRLAEAHHGLLRELPRVNRRGNSRGMRYNHSRREVRDLGIATVGIHVEDAIKTLSSKTLSHIEVIV